MVSCVPGFRCYLSIQTLSFCLRQAIIRKTYDYSDEFIEGEMSMQRAQFDWGRNIVLVVDDNPAIRDMVSWSLELDGYEPAEAAEGNEALAWMDNASREGRYPDVILLDLAMPGMDGHAFLQKLQGQWEATRPFP